MLSLATSNEAAVSDNAGLALYARPAIALDQVGVRYRLPRSRTRSIKELTVLWLRRQLAFDEFWALREVSLRVFPGERLAVIGRNGAGKTTLLQVMARVLVPTEGAAAVTGRVAPLLQLGAGFDYELTGRENVFLNGALLGMSRQEIRDRFQAILDFAEIGDFIEQPLRTYSSGMAARLGFAVATSADPEIMLLDEVLSVGDAAFQAKCIARMREITGRGTTMVITTHDMGFAERQCTRAVWIHGGRVQAEGEPAHVVREYRAFLAEAVAERALVSV